MRHLPIIFGLVLVLVGWAVAPTTHKPTRTTLPHTKLAVYCDAQARDKMSSKTGSEQVYVCCEGYYYATCIQAECKTSKWKSDALCPHADEMGWNHDICSEKKCAALPNKPFPWWIVLIAVGFCVAIVICGLICLVGYKKMHHHPKDGKKGRTIEFGFAKEMNIKSTASGAHHHRHKGSNKSSKKSRKSVKPSSATVASDRAAKTTVNPGTMSTRAQPTGTVASDRAAAPATGTSGAKEASKSSKPAATSFKSRTSQVTAPSKATSTMTKVSKPKVSASTLEKAVA